MYLFKKKKDLFVHLSGIPVPVVARGIILHQSHIVLHQSHIVLHTSHYHRASLFSSFLSASHCKWREKHLCVGILCLILRTPHLAPPRSFSLRTKQSVKSLSWVTRLSAVAVLLLITSWLELCHPPLPGKDPLALITTPRQSFDSGAFTAAPQEVGFNAS